jgi:iron-sulfur cluster repair protein YtfE (RIC family)
MANETITEFFERDHREIDAIFEKLTFQDDKKDLPLFTEFDRRLERHIDWEESILFPAVAAINPMIGQGPVRIMKMEHEAIRHSKAKARQAFEQGKPTEAREHCEAVQAALAEHNMKEERILYPACDQSLDEKTVTGILEKVAPALKP